MLIGRITTLGINPASSTNNAPAAPTESIRSISNMGLKSDLCLTPDPFKPLLIQQDMQQECCGEPYQYEEAALPAIE